MFKLIITKSHSNFNNANKLIALENEIISHYFSRYMYIMIPCSSEQVKMKAFSQIHTNLLV